MITVIKNTRVVQTMSPVEILENVDIVIKDDLIKAVGKDASLKFHNPDKVIDGNGKTVIPGLICSHHHYYSGLSRAMLISSGPQNDLIQTLKEWWWRLDRAIDEESLYYSSLICSLDAIKNGTTCCIDHHESPNYISGSLSTIAKGMEYVGLRGIVAYGITNRNYGMKEIKDGIKEGNRFAKEVDKRVSKGENVLCQAMIGGHAPFTIPNEGLEMLRDSVKSTGRGLHIHVAEGKYDEEWSHHLYNQDIIDRLDKYNLLSDNTLLVHGVYLNDKEIGILNSRDCYLVHNPRSNMNNQVGINTNLPKVKNLVLGTDGCGSNMFEECKIAFFKNRDSKMPYWPSDYLNALTRANNFVAKYHNGKFGKIKVGYKADLDILNYQNPTPLLAENFAGHFVWGMSSNCVESVIINGNLVYENHKFNGIDEVEIYEKASKVAAKLWKKTDKIAPEGI